MEKIKKLLSQNKLSTSIFIFITLIMVILTISLIKIQSQIGVAYWDIFLYLNNALKMAGMGVGDTLYLPPLIPFITSLFFRAGWVSEVTLFAISGFFYIIGTLGLYLLLKIRFNEWESMAGALAFATFSIVIPWAVSGVLDVPAIALSIWAIYFTLMAVKKDAKFFYLAFPVAMLAFLTRYTSGLILLPMLLVIFINHPKKEQLKKAVVGIIIGSLLYIPFMWFFYRQIGNPFPFTGLFVGTASGAAGTNNPGYNLDLLYYLKNLINYLYSSASHNYLQILWPSSSHATFLAYVILGLIIVGIVIYLVKIIKDLYNHNLNDKDSHPMDKIQNPVKLFYIKIIAVVGLSIILVSTYAHMSFLFSEILLMLLSFSIYLLLRDLDLKHLDLDLLFFTWFGAFLLMHSYHPVKVDRYFITMVPPMAYGVALGVNQISSLIRYKFKGFNPTSAVISIVLVIGMLLSTSIYIADMPREDNLVVLESSSAEWITLNIPDYSQKIIVSDRGPAFGWYLKKYVNTRIPRNVEPGKFEETLNKLNTDYYIYSAGNGSLDLKGYKAIKKEGTVVIYQKT